MALFSKFKIIMKKYASALSISNIYNFKISSWFIHPLCII